MYYNDIEIVGEIEMFDGFCCSMDDEIIQMEEYELMKVGELHD